MMFQITVITSSGHSNQRNRYSLLTEIFINKRVGRPHIKLPNVTEFLQIQDAAESSELGHLTWDSLQFHSSPAIKRLSNYHERGHDAFLPHPFQFIAILKHPNMEHNLHSLRSVITKHKRQSKLTHKHHRHHSTCLLVVKLYTAKWYTFSPPYPPSRFIFRYSDSQKFVIRL
jgi:hypothetical protein